MSDKKQDKKIAKCSNGHYFPLSFFDKCPICLHSDYTVMPAYEVDENEFAYPKTDEIKPEIETNDDMFAKFLEDFEKVPAIKLDCCNIKVPEMYSYCPSCGKLIDKENAVIDGNIGVDLATTLLVCSGCEGYYTAEHKYCTNCGKKTGMN